jgi:hypothetical protein
MNQIKKMVGYESEAVKSETLTGTYQITRYHRPEKQDTSLYSDGLQLGRSEFDF